MSKPLKVLGIAAGGHSKMVIETLRLAGQAEVVGLVDSNASLWGTIVAGVRVLGGDELLPDMLANGVKHAFIGLGGVADMLPRKRLYEHALRLGFQVVTAVHPSAIISGSATVGNGATVFAGVIVNAGSVSGENVILNTGAIVEHDCVLGSHIHIATGAKMASAVTVEDEVHVGIGATIRQCLRIGRNSIVGAGAVVVRDVPPKVVVAGIPARILRPVEG